MPDLKLYIPASVVYDPDPDKAARKQHLFVTFVRDVVAKEMTCRMDDGNMMNLGAHEIDLHLMSYGTHGDYKLYTSASVVAEVAGFDYADRMRNIKERLDNISRRIKERVNKNLNDGFDHAVSITFIPIRQDCWVIN